ncbi:MAG: A/G-specific adenine glycosylase [Burkholderiaceae bacterium]|nr:A/G-specific adenine glycosylase [Burkholderiaceae bacterium]
MPRSFAGRVVAWQRAHGRHDLPWQGTRDPYRVWVAEIMLQQTQVATALDYYARFLARFPDVRALAAAPVGEVLRLWAGLGYYARARNLHACARVVVERHGGAFPRSAAALQQLPGIGRSTAAAIAAFCFDERAAILDGNVRRVLARHFGIAGDMATAAVQRRLWQLAESLLPRAADMPAYTQGLMDLGATVCVRAAPRCEVCPLASTCYARRRGRAALLPTPRARRAVAHRRTHWLLAVCRGAILLVRQPLRGLWGGLLAPPQFPSAAAARAAAQALGDASALQRLPALRHAFTHFTLLATPHLVHLARRPRRAAAPHEQWLPLHEVADAALPAPVKTLLRTVATRYSGSTPNATRKRETML